MPFEFCIVAVLETLWKLSTARKFFQVRADEFRLCVSTNVNSVHVVEFKKSHSHPGVLFFLNMSMKAGGDKSGKRTTSGLSNKS
jgi:hypothetical protein